MKNVLGHTVALLLCTLMMGCELLCQAGTGTCGMSREQREKLLHPKAYGEYWTKPEMTKESWRQDWVACGGMSNGSYASDVQSGSSTSVFMAESRQKARQLDACMESKGYTFRRTSP